MTYKDAGVDVKKGEKLVESIKKKVKSTYGNRVQEGVGGFASLYKLNNGKLLAAGTDGVGTKLKIAAKLNIHNTIGIDLVAMCVNDIICTGATPLFFMDYLATSKLDLAISEQVIDGIVSGCKKSKMALIGGETAEMPGMYNSGEYDLAGFAVGEVDQTALVSGTKVRAGNTIIGIASDGLHSNGFSLVNRLIKDDEEELLRLCLTPTKIYSDVVSTLLIKHPKKIKGMAHITGGGFSNIERINKKYKYDIQNVPALNEIPKIFSIIKKRSKLKDHQLYNTFNMGIGFVLITSDPDRIMESLKLLKQKCWVIGKVC
ncbi:MAG: phosphoribosylformylglycinamidine cyclo-ligase [Bacteriovoracaceae bacterium]|nr:phosphoribosylformylglycinamidine cyclo-ligase [Bacteriovoracaceae bacterium]